MVIIYFTGRQDTNLEISFNHKASKILVYNVTKIIANLRFFLMFILCLFYNYNDNVT